MSYKPMKIHPSLFFHTVFLSLLLKFCSALDILTSNATITNGKTLVSLGQSFELGFFSPSNSSKWYIGIWYKKFPEVIVWVANRENPLGNSSGVLTISPDGDLVLLNATTGVVWSSNSSRIEPASVAQLLESGNLVLKRKDDNTENYIWQSFDFPSDTLLPGMKMGWNLSTGANRYLTSWKGNNDPSPGDITYRIDHLGMPQFVLRKGSEKIFRTGPWNGIRFSGTGVPSNILFKVIFVYDKKDLYYKYEVSDDSIITRLAVNQSGLLQRLVLNKGDSSWTTLYSSQNDPCDEYGVCGANGICKISSRPIYIRKGSGGCFMWFGDLIDIREFSEDNEQDIYIRMPASELGHSKKTKLVLITGVSSLSGILILCFMLWCLIQKSKRKRASENKGKDIELPLFDLNIITTATRNFSLTNMIGEGGFGIVYKGTLSTGQQVAVKRLSKNSGQGIQEFKNEVMLIAKLQHRNLVRLLGCCFEGDERMLIYEYMPNKSLDYFIFDQDRKALLTWQKRFEVAMGISRGLLYLHQDSRLRIIHRDLKASNILLDCDLNPKISDFGIARSFDEDLTEIKTKRVIGTYGYMSPEYAVDGKYSVKSDVFSFGVLLLEIVSGKKNRSFHHPDHHHNLLGHAWLLFKEGKALELVDHISELSFVESQVLRCIHVGLLCVQKLSQDRPTMASVVVMLSKEGEALPQPKEPGFFVERSCTETETSTSGERRITQNGVTITVLEAR
ncbi:G-type lectin S-receptor-like serine threonine-kinase At4g27290 isoform X1 [Olea europaea subsp. europaea]|uniref:Receptor-like serine/threonine-protein kinase n=1 Tax=Olea europaea subsp. europaea TaxID=158383 RepID=A0A8S0QAA1_OLEEU|nr:G-type lectin S-receptor-like serine threonine-kinase At4g27290 isoform X1 [Olea europaea subsp. europaea]